MSKTKLPTGWSKSRIGDVVEHSIEQGLPEGKREFTYIDISAVDNHRKEIVEPRSLPITQAPSRARQQVKHNDVLVSTTRPNLNAVALVPSQLDGAIASTGLAVLRPVLLEPRWLFSVVQSDDFVAEMSAQVKGALYPAIRASHVRDYVIPVPPLAEQKRIASKLTKLLKRTRNVSETLKALPELIQQYRAAVLQAACTGRLVPTEAELARNERRKFEPASALLERILVERRTKWEADQLARMRASSNEPKDDRWKRSYTQPIESVTKPNIQLPRGWAWASFDQIARRVTVGYVGSMKNIYIESGIPFLRSQNVRPTGFDPAGMMQISKAFHARLGKSRLAPGDVVVVRSGANVGDTCVIPPSIPVGNCADLVIIQRPLRVHAKFLAAYFNSIARQLVKEGAVGTAQPHFNTRSVATMAIAIPPLAEQKRIVSEMDRMLSRIAFIESQILLVLNQTSELRASFLERALSGKLVPQKHSDEPASQLLLRVRKLKDQLDKQPKVRAVSLPRLKLEKLPMLNLEDIKPTHLADILRRHNEPIDAKTLWQASQLTIDEFYAQLKKELGKTLKEAGKDRLLEIKS